MAGSMLRSRQSPVARTPLLSRLLRHPSGDRRRSTTVTPPPPTHGVEEVAKSHPWPEWAELMKMLLKKGYFESHPLNKERNQIRTACLSFARDRPDIFPYLSKMDILVVVRHGCPNVDRKVVNSAKRLRAFIGIEESDVCQSCHLRGRCQRAYARSYENSDSTVDIMRILLVFGLNLIAEPVESKLLLNKNVEISARNLLSFILQFSAKMPESICQEMTSEDVSATLDSSGHKQLAKEKSNRKSTGDWVCSKCNFVNFSKNLRCLHCNGISQEKLKKMRADREHLPLKKGDWICSMCDFFNFARSSRCLHCNEKPKDRYLNVGEWECTSCNFINFKRNQSCLRCGWKQPKASVSEINFSRYPQHENSENAIFWSSAEDESDIDANVH